MEQNKTNITNYKLKGLLGLILSIAISFLGVGFKITFLVPTSLVLGLFFVGYLIKGKIKDGFIWAIIFVIFLSLMVMLGYALNS